MSERPLRPDQADMIERVRESLRAGHKRPLIQFPTGGGKTRIMTEISKMALEKGNKSILFAPRRELIKQGAKDLESEGMKPSIIMAGYTRTRRCDGYVASFDTVNSRVINKKTEELPEVGLAHIDEAHLSITKSRLKIMGMFPCPVVGWTATPAKGDGTGLGMFYDDLLIGPSPQELIDLGVLVPPKYFGCTADIDFGQLEFNKDDYTEKALATLEDKESLIGDVVSNWERLAKDRQTVVFGTNIKHARNLCREFIRKGYKAALLTSETPEPERAAILEGVVSKRIQVLVNVFIASYGLDIPSLDCAVIARPTKNISLWLQTVGRVLRVDRQNPDKKDALIIDHVQAIQENGFVEEAQPWSLNGSEDIREKKAESKKEKKEPKPITCEACQFVFTSSRSCPKCGHTMLKADEQIPAFDYSLEEIRFKKSKDVTNLNKHTTVAEKESFIRQLNWYASSKGYKYGWSAMKYREKFGVWPNKINKSGSEPPLRSTLDFIKSSNEKYRYQQRKRQQHLTETNSLV